MPDDDFMQDPGDGEAPPPPGEEEARLAYLADAPEWAIMPPGANVFANSTWLEAGKQFIALVDSVLGFEEFDQLRQLSYEVRWRRKSKPQLKARWGDQPIFATIDVVPARMIWEAYKQGCETMPRLLIDFHWQHFEDRRDEGFYVHEGELKRDIHRALSRLEVTNDIIGTVAPDVQEFAATIQRFGLANPGLLKMRQQMALWPDEDAT